MPKRNFLYSEKELRQSFVAVPFLLKNILEFSLLSCKIFV